MRSAFRYHCGMKMRLLALVLASFPVLRVAVAQSSTPPADASFELPAALAYERPLVFQDENATTLWLDAAALLQPIDDPALEAAIEAWLDPRTRTPPDETTLAAIDRWIGLNTLALQAYEQSLARPALLPERHEELSQFYGPLTTLVTLERLRSRRLVAQDKMVESAAALTRAMTLADLVEDAHGPVVAVLFAQTLRERVYAEMRHWFASRGSLSRTTQPVVDILAKRPPRPERWRRAVAAEYHSVVAPQIDVVAREIDAMQLREQMVNAVLDEPDAELGPDARRELAAAIERNTLFDAAATRHAVADIYARFARLQMNARRQDRTLAADIAAYSRNREAENVAALRAFDDDPDADPETLAARRATMDEALTNVVGRRLIQVAAPDVPRDLLYGGLARHRMMTVAAALKMFELRHRTLPENLADAIDLGAPPEMLYDPRDGKEFTYDRVARTLGWDEAWSADPARPFEIFVPPLPPDADN